MCAQLCACVCVSLCVCVCLYVHSTPLQPARAVEVVTGAALGLYAVVHQCPFIVEMSCQSRRLVSV